MTESFSVCLTSYQLPPLNDIAKPFAQFRNILVPDALPLIKHRWGLVEENLEQSEAERLSKLFMEAGLANVVISGTMVENNMPPHAVAAIRVDEKGMGVSVQADAWQIIPWKAFSLLGVAVLKEKIMHTTTKEQGPSAQEKLLKTGILLATGIPLPMTRKSKVTTTTEETNLHYYLDLFIDRPRLRLRLEGHKLDYQFLKEKMVMSAQENFRTLLREFLKHAPQVLRNGSFERMASPQALAITYHDSVKSFDQECRWLLTLLHSKKNE